MLRTVSIIPGIENFAPERTETSSGSSACAELAAHRLLEGGRWVLDLGAQLGRLVAGVEVDLAGLGGDREAGRHREPEVGHLGEVGALAAQQVLHVPAALGEVVDVLRLLVRHFRTSHVAVNSV